ncbi:PhzF family phenazine biosynthesis isomerase [Streptomyces sp. N50]|uniref:PhzF family phenazine biosynthesis protein n=1 Tax=Streptomyces sp. N50 TaxID=3081765 RepID=UPI0029621C5C|nr:PhzF family phenazine biosynthesis isomerase [Streptomyces sp. N50]WOX07677.1 PhzF family phenazine biosynthesis isomerase [Streptomyces sp. N50]
MISRLSVSIVRACLRAGAGGSPTAVLDEVPLSDEERCRVPVLAGTSHAVFVSVRASEVSLRFFTAGGELPACGHGTVAALAFLAARAPGSEYRGTLSAAGRSFAGRAVREGARFRAVFEPGPVESREPTPDECAQVLPALGVTSDTLAPGARVASVGRERLLVPVASRSQLAAITPDFEALRAACDRFGLLGCYVYSVPTRSGRLAARMFAPSIGVPEDIDNANSTACLAADLAGRGITEIAVDMGDALGSPATITASARPVLRLGGVAEVAGAVRELTV